MKDKYDVIIIGAGIGGLVCGCYLAKSGMKVLVVEKNKNAGGCASSININGFVFDMGAHLVGACGKGGLFNYYLNKLGVSVDFVKLNLSDRFVFDKKIVEVEPLLNDYISTLQKMFPREKTSIVAFFDELIKIYRGYLLSKGYLSNYSRLTYQDFLDSFTKNKMLQGILSAQCPYIGLPPCEASVVAMSFMMISYLRDGVYYVKGGMQVLANELCKKIMEYSGEILYENEVKQIIVRNNKSEGIILHNDENVFSTYVVSNIDAEKTFCSLTNKNNINRSFEKKMRRIKKSTSILQAHFAIDVSSENFKNAVAWHYDSYDINKSMFKATYVFSPTLIDESVSPKSKTVINMLKFFPYKDIARVKEVEVFKNEMRGSFLKTLSGIAKIDLQDKILHSIVTTPKDIEKFTGNACGATYGWEMSPCNILGRRIANNTCVNNLFLTGHWTRPGCGVLGVASSGMETANMIVKHL